MSSGEYADLSSTGQILDSKRRKVANSTIRWRRKERHMIQQALCTDADSGHPLRDCMGPKAIFVSVGEVKLILRYSAHNTSWILGRSQKKTRAELTTCEQTGGSNKVSKRLLLGVKTTKHIQKILLVHSILDQ